MNAFADLMAFQRDTEALAQISGRLGWDQETMMPEGAAAQRSDEMAAIEGFCMPAVPIRVWVNGWPRPRPLMRLGQQHCG